MAAGAAVRAAAIPEGDSLGLLISSLRAFVRAIVWLVALALILRVLGFDITAILAGLGIGGLAIGLAAKDMIADIISALVIFLERRFKIGDVLRIGQEKEPAKVVGLNWRMTQLKGPDGLSYNVPNRTVTNRRIQNLTSQGKTHDSLDVIVTTAEDVQPVLQAIREVIDANPDLGPASERGLLRGEGGAQGGPGVARPAVVAVQGGVVPLLVADPRLRGPQPHPRRGADADQRAAVGGGSARVAGGAEVSRRGAGLQPAFAARRPVANRPHAEARPLGS